VASTNRRDYGITGDAVTTGSPGISVSKRELFFGSSQLVSAEVVLPDLENSLLFGTKIAG